MRFLITRTSIRNSDLDHEARPCPEASLLEAVSPYYSDDMRHFWYIEVDSLSELLHMVDGLGEFIIRGPMEPGDDGYSEASTETRKLYRVEIYDDYRE